MLTHVRYMKMEGYIYEIYKAKYSLFYSQPLLWWSLEC